MKKLLSIVLFVVSTSSFAQTAIKLNAHSQYHSTETIWKYNTSEIIVSMEENTFSVLPMPTISFFNSTGNFHELGLSNLKYKVDETQSIMVDNSIRSGEKVHTFEIALRYDYNFELSKNIKALKPYLGVSASLGYSNEINVPKITSAFKSNENKLVSSIGIVPRMVWKLNETIFLDLNIPINVFQVEYKSQRIHNPSLPLEQQRNSIVDVSFLPINYEVRLGIGVLLVSS